MTDEIKIRRYSENDVAAMVAIWNEVVEDGVAFPQEEFLTEATVQSRRTVESRKTQGQKKFWDFISCIRIISEDAGISVMRAIRSRQKTVDFISASGWDSNSLVRSLADFA